MTKLENIDRYFKGDKMIWLVIMLLSTFSLLVVFSSTAAIVGRSSGLGTLSFFSKHLMFLIIGFGIMYLISRTPYTFFMGFSKVGFWFSIALLIAMFVLGRTYNQSIRTLFGFQPAEVAKILLIVYVARLLTIKQDSIGKLKEGFLQILWPVLAVCSLIFLSNFSTAAILGCTCFTMMFIGRVRIKHLALTIGAAALLLSVALLITKVIDDKVEAKQRKKEQVTGMLATSYKVISKTRLQTIYGRIFSKINEVDISEKKVIHATQADYSRMAIASGGLVFGKGPGNSTMRYRLPEAFSDFVFAIVAEEYGVAFACVLLLCYLIILYRVGVMTRKATHFFPTLLAIGISTQITLQALVNMCVATGITPVTGQNLPFISQGGSSIIITCVMFGMLLSVSRSQEEMEAMEKERMEKAAAREAEKEQASAAAAASISSSQGEELAVATLKNINS